MVQDHLGHKYKSIKEMCKMYSINPSTYKARMARGMSVKDALTKEITCSSDKGTVCADHKGNKYRSYSEMARAYHIPPSVLRDRISRGLSIEEALRKKEVYDHKGNSYYSERELCRAYNISITTYKNRLKNGLSIEEALTIPTGNLLGNRCVDHLNNEYRSVRELCVAYGIDHSTFRHRIAAGMSLEEALTSRDIIDHKGRVYRSELEMCKAYRIDNSTFRYRIRQGFSLEEALTIPKQYSLGEYRVSKVLDVFSEKGRISSYLHNVQIKRLFEILNLIDKYYFFMDCYENELKNNHINISRRKLAKFRFDFSIIKDGDVFAFIEFDGIQHFRFVDLFFKTFEEFISGIDRDNAKNLFAEVIGIPLLRIRFDQIEEKMVIQMVDDLLRNPQAYLVRHNTFLSNEEYMDVFREETMDVIPGLL